MLKHAKRETHMKHEKREKSYDKKTYFCNIYSLDFIRLVFKEKYLQKNVPQSVWKHPLVHYFQYIAMTFRHVFNIFVQNKFISRNFTHNLF